MAKSRPFKRSPKELRLTFKKRAKREQRTQFAAFCYRVVKGKVQVLLVTSRKRQRWIIPKGWPMDGKTPAEAALQESFEEGGVVGKVRETPIGVYAFDKLFHDKEDLAIIAVAYPVKVKKLKSGFPEKGQRKRKWFSLKKAAKKVGDKQLARLIKSIDPASLK